MNEADRRFVQFCEEVNQRALQVMAAASNAGAERAAGMALSLSDFASDRREAVRMQHERSSSGSYDLSTLAVNAAAPSNSETGYEDRG